jgi:23S rRNA (pseudouridine1915-N3)-methyltransferase
LKAVLLRVGRGRTSWADEAAHDYGRRLRQKLPLVEELVKPARFRGDEQEVKDAEAAAILARIRPGDRLVALDERGDLPTTESFATLIDDATRTGAHRLVFAIGGPYGHGAAVRQRAWKTVALSRMVLNHELARVVLIEQLYRASTLLWGGSYHH